MLLHFNDVVLTCGKVGVRMGRVETTLVPGAIELGNEDIAIEHFGPSEAGAEKVWVRNEDGGDFTGATELANVLNELD